MALCAGLAPLNNNHFGRRALLRGRRLYAITATALIEEMVIFCVNSAAGRRLQQVSRGCWHTRAAPQKS